MTIQNSTYYYRYRLSDNVTYEKMNINGVDLTKKWTVFSAEQIPLKPVIRTKDNPTNVVDYEKFDGKTQETLKSSWVDFKKWFPYYSRETLVSMHREQLEIICNSYNISTPNMRNEFLVNKILAKQEIYKTHFEEEKNRKRKEILEEVADKAARKILNQKLSEQQELIVNEELITDLKEKIIEDLEQTDEESLLKKN